MDGWKTGIMSFVSLVAIVVHSYDPAIRFFVDVLGFELVEDVPSLTDDGRPKRWVVVRLPNAETGILLAQADGPGAVDGCWPTSSWPGGLLPWRR